MNYQNKSLIFRILLLGFFSLFAFSVDAQVTTTDTVCAGSQNVQYGVLNPNATSTYTWGLVNNAGGTIDNSISTNDSLIEIDWGSTPGTYTLYVVETGSNGCNGDSVSINIVVQAAPTLTIVGDSVCINAVSQMTWTLTGTAPWTVDYTDGTNNYTEVVNSSPHTVNLPAYASTTTITITSISDVGGTCTVNSALPTTTIYVYPKPSTGAIFHY